MQDLASPCAECPENGVVCTSQSIEVKRSYWIYQQQENGIILPMRCESGQFYQQKTFLCSKFSFFKVNVVKIPIIVFIKIIKIHKWNKVFVLLVENNLSHSVYAAKQKSYR